MYVSDVSWDEVLLMVVTIAWSWYCTVIHYLLTHSLTPRSRVHLEKLTGFHLVKKFPTFYGTRRYITAFTSARHLPLSWANSIQPTSWRSLLILSFHLRLGLPNGSFRQVSPPKLCIPLLSPIRATWPAHLFLLDMITRIVLGEYRTVIQYIPVKFNFSRISSQRFDLRSHFWYFFSFWSQKGVIYLTSTITVLSTARIVKIICSTSVWPNCRLQTNLLCWARQSGVGRQHAAQLGLIVATTVSNKVADFYFLVCILSGPLCCIVSCRVGSASNVAVPLDRGATRTDKSHI
jgi:hypothetical protein